MDAPASELAYVVRYGSTRILGEFTARNLPSLARNSPVIVRSDRGHEWQIHILGRRIVPRCTWRPGFSP